MIKVVREAGSWKVGLHVLAFNRIDRKSNMKTFIAFPETLVGL